MSLLRLWAFMACSRVNFTSFFLHRTERCPHLWGQAAQSFGLPDAEDQSTTIPNHVGNYTPVDTAEQSTRATRT